MENAWKRGVSNPNSLDSDWIEVHAGRSCFFARKKDGSWWAGGSNTDGQFGFSPRQQFGPQRLPFDFEPWAFASGYEQTLLLTHAGVLWSWGSRTGAKNTQHLQLLKRTINNSLNPLPGHPHPFNVNDTPFLIDYSPHRLWELPASVRSSLGKQTNNAANSTGQ